MNTLKAIELEQALIGGLLLNNGPIDGVAAILQPEHMAEAAHAAIYADILRLSQRGHVDATLLAPRFADHPLLAQAGFGAYLEDLQAAAIRSAPLIDYAKQLLDLYKRRALIAAFQETTERLADPDQSFTASVRDLDALLTGLDVAGQGSPVVSFAAAQSAAMDLVDEGLRAGRAGHLSPFQRLNDLTGPLMPGNLIIIAARPAMGKTAFVTELALHLARKGQRTLFASLEMAQEELLERIAAKDLGLSFLDIGDYAGDLAAQRKVFDWLQGSRFAHLSLADLSAPNVAQIRALAKRQKKAGGLDVLIIDYLQLMSGPSRGMSEFAITEHNSKALKALAKELKICLICLSQLNRGVEGREDRRPRLQDLRNSGSIEQDADKVLMLYRPAYYLEQELPGAIDKAEAGREGAHEALHGLQSRLKAQRTILNIGVVKNRRGATGSADIGWDPRTMRFWGLEREAA